MKCFCIDPCNKSVTTRKFQKQQRIDTYNLNPNKCTGCSTSLIYESRKNKYCSHSCSTHYTNKNRKRTNKSKLKASSAAKKFHANNPNIFKKICHITFCKVCTKLIKGTRKSCSANCKYQLAVNSGLASAATQVRRSKDEIKLFELCNNYFKTIRHNEPLVNGWDADIIIDDYKIAVLWNGPWHYKQMPHKNHSLLQVQTRDKIKHEQSTNSGWKVLVFEDRYYTIEDAFSEIKLVAESGNDPALCFMRAT